MLLLPFVGISLVHEEYVEAIYRQEKKFRCVRTKNLSDDSGKPATVTNASRHLKSLGFLVHEPDQGTKLTEEDGALALDAIRRRHLDECLLMDLIGVNWSILHEEARKLEHGMSEDVVESLEERLDPHENPVPNELGGLREKAEPNLSQMKEGDEGRITSIIDERTDILRYFETLGLTPGAHVRLAEKLLSKVLSLFKWVEDAVRWTKSYQYAFMLNCLNLLAV